MIDKGLIKYTLHDVKPPFNDEKQRRDAYKAVFNSELGGLVLQDFLARISFFNPFVPNANQASSHLASSFDDGKKFAGHIILEPLTSVLKSADIDELLTEPINNYDNEPTEIL